MDIRQLSYFAEVAVQKSISKAAQKISISQPALSKCIQALEQELDVRLFIRERGKNLILTEEGKAVLEDAKSLLSHHNALQRKYNKAFQCEKKSLSIGFSHLLSSVFGSELIAAFLRDNEQFVLSYAEGSVQSLIDKVYNKELDAAVCLICHNNYENIKQISVDSFHQGHFIAAMKSSHDEAAAPTINLRNIRHNIVTTNEMAVFINMMNYQIQSSIFYEDWIDGIHKKVVTNKFIAIIPDIICSFFSQDILFNELKESIQYQLAFITRDQMSTPKTIKRLKKYITSNYLTILTTVA